MHYSYDFLVHSQKYLTMQEVPLLSLILLYLRFGCHGSCKISIDSSLSRKRKCLQSLKKSVGQIRLRYGRFFLILLWKDDVMNSIVLCYICKKLRKNEKLHHIGKMNQAGVITRREQFGHSGVVLSIFSNKHQNVKLVNHA